MHSQIRNKPDRNGVARIYTELRRVACGYLAQERVGHTLNPTALVHEAFLRTCGSAAEVKMDRPQLMAQAARAMRLTLVDYARQRTAQKRQAEGERLPLDEALRVYTKRAIDLPDLDEALERLGDLDAQLSNIVELRFFGGMTTEETAMCLGVSKSTVVRGWRFARLWLFKELADKPDDDT